MATQVVSYLDRRVDFMYYYQLFGSILELIIETEVFV